MRLVGKIWMVVIVVGVVCGSAQGKYGGGTGEPNDPYQIWDANHMQAIGADANDWDKCFVLMADIDLGQFDGKDEREKFNMIGWYHCEDYCDGVGFAGVFNGNNHSISNFTSPDEQTVGLFAHLGGGTITDLGLVDPNVRGGLTVGVLVGQLSSGTISRCYVEGGYVFGAENVGGLVGGTGYCFFDLCYGTHEVSDCYVVGTVVVGHCIVGGLVASNMGSGNLGSIRECYSRANVISGGSFAFGVGGLVGWNGGTITLCHSSGSVLGETEVGGLVGVNARTWAIDYSGGIITDCYSTSDVTGTLTSVGGLVGRNCDDGSVLKNCYSTGDVSGDASVGGLAGMNCDGSVLNCYSTGDISGQWGVGGLVGGNSCRNISNCYSTGDVSGDGDVGGLMGYSSSSGSVSNCYSTGDVSGDGDHVGGLVGANYEGSVWNCYSTGDIMGTGDFVGGLVGYNGWGILGGGQQEGYIFNSYSTGSVQGASHVGGLVGYHHYGGIERSYWNIETSGEPNMCGNPENPNCDPNYGLPTSQLQQQSTFTDWDFINVWDIGENQTYPYLRTVLPSDLNKDKITNFLDLCIVAEEWMREE